MKTSFDQHANDQKDQVYQKTSQRRTIMDSGH